MRSKESQSGKDQDDHDQTFSTSFTLSHFHLIPFTDHSNMNMNMRTRLISSLNPSSQSGLTTNQNKRRKNSSPVQVNDPRNLLEERNLPEKKERQVKDKVALRIYRLLLV